MSYLEYNKLLFAFFSQYGECFFTEYGCNFPKYKDGTRKAKVGWSNSCAKRKPQSSPRGDSFTVCETARSGWWFKKRYSLNLITFACVLKPFRKKFLYEIIDAFVVLFNEALRNKFNFCSFSTLRCDSIRGFRTNIRFCLLRQTPWKPRSDTLFVPFLSRFQSNPGR